MISRCTRPGRRQDNFKHYGGRGIKVCERWRKSFAAFLEDVPPRPSIFHTLERENNSGHYEPGNVTWATRKQQGRNMRSNVIVTVRGEKMCLIEATEKYGIPYKRVHLRLSRGWNIERALELE
jgi:hypothetical protein